MDADANSLYTTGHNNNLLHVCFALFFRKEKGQGCISSFEASPFLNAFLDIVSYGRAFFLHPFHPVSPSQHRLSLSLSFSSSSS